MTEANTAPAVSQETAASVVTEAAAVEMPSAEPKQSYADRIAALVAEDPALAPAPAAEPAQPADKPKETPPPQTEQDRALADAALKEGRAWRLQQQLKRERDAFTSERAEWAPKVEAAQKYESSIAKGDVIGAVQQLAERMNKPFHELYFALSKQVADTTTDKTPQQIAEEAADRKLAAYRAEREAERQKEQAEAQDRERKALNQRGQDEALQQVTDQLAKDADRWPVLSGYDHRMVAGQVLHLMTEDFTKKRAEHGKEYAARNVLDFEDALDMIESRKQAQAQADYERAAAKKKAAQAIGNAAPAASPTGHTAGRPRTIEHSHVADAATPRKLTYQERLAQLIAEDDRKG